MALNSGYLGHSRGQSGGVQIHMFRLFGSVVWGLRVALGAFGLVVRLERVV